MTQPDPRTAISDRREQITSEPRPTRLGDAATEDSGDNLWRVYRPEWLIVYVTDGSDGVGERIDQYIADKLVGRVRDEDIRLVTEGEPPHGIAQLQVRKPNMRGEFKHLADARAFASDQGWDDAVLVKRNSPADHDLRMYGTKRLPTT